MWTPNARKPDYSRAPYNPEQATVNSQPQQHVRPISDEERRDALARREALKEQVRKSIKPIL